MIEARVRLTTRLQSERFRLVVVLIIALLAAGIIIVPSVNNAHAQGQTGTVCITQPSDLPSACGAAPSPPTFNMTVTSPNTLIRVAVYINDSEPMNGFDVVLLANHNYLTPVGFDLTGDVLSSFSPTVFTECIGTKSIKGICSSADTADTFELSALAVGTSLTGEPTTGILFTAIYNITGTTGPGGIAVGFQQSSSCSGPDYSTSSNYCIAVTGSQAPISDPETAQAATFNNSGGSPPYVLLSSNAASNTTLAGGTVTLKVTARSEDSFPNLFSTCSSNAGQVSYSTTVSNPSLTASMTPSTATLAQGGNANSTLSVTVPSSPSADSYTITVYGLYCTYDSSVLSGPNGMNETLVATLTVNVLVEDFSLASSPSSLTTPSPGLSATTLITVSSVNGFAGTVTFTNSTSPATGISLHLNATSTTLSSGGTRTLNETVTGHTPGTYTVTITGQGDSFTHKIMVTVTVNSQQVLVLGVTVSSTSATVGDTVTYNIQVKNVGAGTVTTTVYALVGNVTVNQMNVTLAPGASQSVTLTWNTASYTPGTYTLGAKILAAPGQNNFTDITGTATTSFALAAKPSSPFTLTVIAIIAVIAAAAIIVVVLLLRRRRPIQSV
jgi:hypothetical protein